MNQKFLLVLGLGLLILRGLQAERDFEGQCCLFPEPQKGLFEAWVSEEPEVFFEHLPGSHATGRTGENYAPFVKEVRTVCTLLTYEGKTLPPIKVRCAFRFSGEEPQPVLSYGEVVRMDGKIQLPSPAQNPGQFDYAHYLKTKGVAYVMYLAPGKWGPFQDASSCHSEPPVGDEESMGKTKILRSAQDDNARHGSFFLRWSYGLKRWAEDSLYTYLPYPQNALLDGILLGERASLPDEMVESFFLTGTIHILAVSGMITAFLAGLFFTLFRALQFKRKWAAALTLVALLFFIFVTGAHPPVCRAGLFSALALLAVLWEKRVHSGALLLVTAFILLAVNPFVLEDLSFQISFLATAGLMVMASWMMEKLAWLWKPVAFLITSTTAAQLAVWVLIIFCFNQISLYSIFSNLLIVPLALFSAAAGVTLLAGAAIHPALGTLFGAACELPLKLLAFLAKGLAKLPWAEWVVASPPLPWVLAFHVLLLFTFLCYWPGHLPENPSESWKRRRAIFLKGRQIALGAWALFILGTGGVVLARSFSPQPLRVIFLSVGHGNAVVLRSPQGKVLVVDGGKETHGPDRYNLVVSYLRHEGVGRVEAVLDTHPDEDHVGGLVNLLWAYPVRTAYEGTQAQADTRVYERFKQAIRDRRVTLRTLREGDSLKELDPAQVTVLHPSDNYTPKLKADNNRSLVSLVSYGGVHFILPGDLEKDGLLKLFRDNRPFPKVDWLMAPHHGRRSGEPLLCAKGFEPRFVVLSDWRDYPEDHQIFQSQVPGAVIFSTAEEGAIEVEISSDGKGRYRGFREGKWKDFAAGN